MLGPRDGAFPIQEESLAGRDAASGRPAPLREAVDREMRELTNLGNAFKIRHFETDKVPVPPEASDYLMTRMSALMVFLLERLGRLDLS